MAVDGQVVFQTALILKEVEQAAWWYLLAFLDSQHQGPRSNFEFGVRGTISDSILGGQKTLFLTNSL